MHVDGFSAVSETGSTSCNCQLVIMMLHALGHVVLRLLAKNASAVLFDLVLFATWNCLDSQILGQFTGCKPGMGQKCSSLLIC
jgi:hypothetical protein